jgi:hypothetical protein
MLGAKINSAAVIEVEGVFYAIVNVLSWNMNTI